MKGPTETLHVICDACHTVIHRPKAGAVLACQRCGGKEQVQSHRSIPSNLLVGTTYNWYCWTNTYYLKVASMARDYTECPLCTSDMDPHTYWHSAGTPHKLLWFLGDKAVPIEFDFGHLPDPRIDPIGIRPDVLDTGIGEFIPKRVEFGDGYNPFYGSYDAAQGPDHTAIQLRDGTSLLVIDDVLIETPGSFDEKRQELLEFWERMKGKPDKGDRKCQFTK